MSLRNVRKMFGTTNTLPPLEGNSDEEFEPLYSKESKSKFTFDGLELSSHSDSEHEEQEIEKEPEIVEKKPKKNKNNKKKRRRSKPDGIKMDEIDKSLMEVNAMLGAPPAPSTSAPEQKPSNPQKVLLSVQSKHLDFNNELKRLFGSESLDDSRGKKYRPHNVVKYRRAVIVPIPENKHFHNVGFSMSLQRRENGCSYFTFDHNKGYQKLHQAVMVQWEGMSLDNSHSDTHIEGLLESADSMFRAEEYTSANNILEAIISYFHYIAHPAFNLTDQSVRLEYKYLENRPFFIAVLKYLHMLTNKACHRTGLELAKLLLNLDPSDPLAIIYIIDVIALRAREHQWLIDIIEYWNKTRDAQYLFNLQYSNALAHYHIVKKNKSVDFSHADQLLQDAMLLYPTIAVRIFENSTNEAFHRMRSHPYFDLAADGWLPEKLKSAIILYAKLVCWRWREPPVAAWFFRNVGELLDKLDNDPHTKARGERMCARRYQLLGGCPEELHRHLLVVRPMTNLLVEWDMPSLVRHRSWDPLPPANTINRYRYCLASEINMRFSGGLFSIFSRYLEFGQEIHLPIGVIPHPGVDDMDDSSSDGDSDDGEARLNILGTGFQLHMFQESSDEA